MGVTSVAIVHDYLTQRGGAERVVLSMLKAFPDAPLYTSLYDPERTYPEFAEHDVRPMWTNHVGALRRNHRRGLPVYPFAFSSLRVGADVVVCSSSGFAHGVRAHGRKVVYCHTPPRWLYDQAATYVAHWPAPIRVANRWAGGPLRAWDRRAASTASAYLANSSVVRARVQAAYGVDARVVPPPVSHPKYDAEPVAGVQPGFVLSPTRLLRYKNVDAVVRAFDRLPDARLVVAGDGPERRRLSALAGTNVRFLGRVTDGELHWLYANCAGLVSASFEDFGLTPLEAALHGKPSAVLGAGGFLDTVIAGKTGLFFDSLEPDAIANAVDLMLGNAWDASAIAQHASRYGEDGFLAALRDAAAAA